MRRLAFLFPGQESLIPRMGLAVAERSGPAKALLELASSLIGLDLPRLLRRGGPALSRTEVVQPAVVAVALGALAEVQAAGLEPDLLAGLSLGELPALCAAGGLTPEATLRLAAERGRLMGEAARRAPGGMLALRDADEALVAEALTLGRRRGLVVVAAVNSPDEVVLSGERPALRAIAGAFRTSPLPMAGAFHSPLMVEAVAPLRQALEEALTAPLRAPLVANAEGLAVDASTDLAALLADQLVRPVRWATCLETLVTAGVTDLVTLGPSRVLRALLRRNDVAPPACVHGTDDLVELRRTLEALGGVAALRGE